eukprot:TRINITY_DN1444_c0_g1_i2.p2 TRINITY_DN1444_c0_g1~~TRINITY_DN1444_c0_g1_i2.p2  ORF type:complete len:193 (+),score=84.15 TRINITY_DN1444_c0_g1_i2:74-580(+)
MSAEAKVEIPHHGVAGTNQERTFLALKPDAVQRNLIGEVIRRFEQRGYKLVGLKMIRATQAQAEEHYADLSSKPFFAGLVQYFISGPIVLMAWEGKNVIAGARKMMGETNPNASAPGTIRGDYAQDVGRNIIHGSDSAASAERELTLWFKPEDIVSWSANSYSWVFEN